MKEEILSEDVFFGAATVGERGQVVIPAEARKRYGIHPGDKVLVMGHPGASGIVLCKFDALRAFFSSALEDLDRIASAQSDPAEECSEN